jgi:hypothetical protein
VQAHLGEVWGAEPAAVRRLFRLVIARKMDRKQAATRERAVRTRLRRARRAGE